MEIKKSLKFHQHNKKDFRGENQNQPKTKANKYSQKSLQRAHLAQATDRILIASHHSLEIIQFLESRNGRNGNKFGNSQQLVLILKFVPQPISYCFLFYYERKGHKFPYPSSENRGIQWNLFFFVGKFPVVRLLEGIVSLPIKD